MKEPTGVNSAEIEASLLTPKLLQKLKDYSLDHKFDSIPKDLNDYWVEALWMKGMFMLLSANGYEIVPEDSYEKLLFERNEYKKLAESWMKDYDELKAKYEPLVLKIED